MVDERLKAFFSEDTIFLLEVKKGARGNSYHKPLGEVVRHRLRNYTTWMNAEHVGW
jgi:hypothetical protein